MCFFPFLDFFFARVLRQFADNNTDLSRMQDIDALPATVDPESDCPGDEISAEDVGRLAK